MSTPSSIAGNDGGQHASASPSTDTGQENTTEIPRRLMRVKVLYTFDDENKSNCLARLPNAMNIPTVSLDETTQVGVIELKACIQAIVAASPELVARLGHDYTVYAFDYSEYETPLVGQGMLSWILSSASTTPNAPAEESQTMVTGRVCKNIMGLFSNGIKETLEVKLKLVPVPTCMQREYVENMERYHNLSKIMPEGMDYSGWADFLKANPAFSQLAQPVSDSPAPGYHRDSIGGVEPFHQMLTRMTPPGEMMRSDAYQNQLGMPFKGQDLRPGSPTMSTASFHNYSFQQDSRPASRASYRSEPTTYSPHHQHTADLLQEQQEEGPPKKRARVTKASRPKKTALDAINDSLRVTASTAASVRLHRPVPSNRAAALASVEQIPRAPTPRPGEMGRFQHHTGNPRPPPSLLRHASMDEGPRRYMSPYHTSTFSDNAMYSADDDNGSPDGTAIEIKASPGNTPMEIPSSPPVMPQRAPSSVPSSPGLPALPPPIDSGFVSDMLQGREEEETERGEKLWDGSDLLAAPEVKVRAKPDRSNHPWTEVTPGPVELLPKSYIPKPKTYPRPRPMQPIAENARQNPEHVHPAGFNTSFSNPNGTTGGVARSYQSQQDSSVALENHGSLHRVCGDTASFPPMDPGSSARSHESPIQNPSYDTTAPRGWSECLNHQDPQAVRRFGTPNPSTNPSKSSKSRGLARSQTWSGEPMSDTAGPGDSKAPRSGSGRRRRLAIKDKLDQSLRDGEMPTFCNNCGQIETPTWRKAYMRVESGTPDNVHTSSEGTSIVAYEVLEAVDDNDGPSYRIFKQALTEEEKALETYTALVLCNPCGLWLNKKKAMRPPTVWAKPTEATTKEKRKRNRAPKDSHKKAKGEEDSNMSDAIIPDSEPVTAGDNVEAPAPFDGSADTTVMQPPVRPRASSFQTTARAPRLDDGTAQAALWRAIQSSPVGVRGTRDSPIDIERDLTPRPTRRLLFPSPRKDGETKSLADARSSTSPTPKTFTQKMSESHALKLNTKTDDVDKENCPPPTRTDNEHGLTHIFEDRLSPKITPTKGMGFEDLLKTPTPGSRQRVSLTPSRNIETGSLATPSRITRTPRTGGRAGILAPETPFTRQMNALFSDHIPSSPSQAVDFIAFPTFNTPGRNNPGGDFYNYHTDDFLSSDIPAPSSPPARLDFSVFEDPNTSTNSLWSGASMFEGSDAIMPDADGETQLRKVSIDGAMLEMSGISADFAAMIEKVVGATDRDEKPSSDSQGSTPENITGAE